MAKDQSQTGLSSTQIDRHIGERIRERRTLLGFTQETLAEILGISYQQVQKYETGANRVTAGRLFQIAQCLDCNVAIFFDGLGTTTQQTKQGTHDQTLSVSSRAVIELVRSFQAIPSEATRAALVNLARTMSNETPLATDGPETGPRIRSANTNGKAPSRRTKSRDHVDP